MLRSRTVEGFALPYRRGGIALIKCNSSMGRGRKVLVDFRVAIFTAFRTHVSWRQFSRHGRLGLGANIFAPKNANQAQQKCSLAPDQRPSGHDQRQTKISERTLSF